MNRLRSNPPSEAWRQECRPSVHRWQAVDVGDAGWGTVRRRKRMPVAP
ncbi:hypothetical protein [Microbacterium paraoxydans]|nr:hypothetical protein [Microbacterium paraoxydans]MCT2223819.1 hypothetical protein [Microbacterium paraoxydans]